MNKNQIIIIGLLVIALICIFAFKLLSKKEEKSELNTKEVLSQLEGTIISRSHNSFTVLTKNNSLYTLGLTSDFNIDNKKDVVIKYKGNLDTTKSTQDINVVECLAQDNNDEIPSTWNDNGIFSKFYKLAYNDMKNMTLDEKIAQLLLVRHPQNNDVDILKQYPFGGFVFFKSDFDNKNKEQVQTMINNLQNASKIPLLTAVDEEGGSVVRISSNKNLAPEKFMSPKELYNAGGLDLIREDTITKSALLKELGLNVNLAPVVDVTVDESDYMFERALGQNTGITSQYAQIVIEASKDIGVSYTLKHFPGYGNNTDTHTGSSTDNRTWENIQKNDIPPFRMGISSGAESVLVSHNIVTSIDSTNPASLSPSIHNILRNDLNYTGIIMTDDISMGATSSIEDAAVKAILAGNELIITTDYEASFNSIKNAINDGTISEEMISKYAFRVIAWKYYKGLMYEENK